MQRAQVVHPSRKGSPHIVHRMATALRTNKSTKSGAAVPHGAPNVRLRPALRHAIDEIVWKGKTQRDAAKIAGMNETALARALARPQVAAFVEHLKAQATLDAAKLKEQARNIAIREGMRLLTEAQSEAVRARLVEFFAGEPRGAGVVVQVNNPAPVGYAYRRPDSASEAIEGQAVEIKGPTKPVD